MTRYELIKVIINSFRENITNKLYGDYAGSALQRFRDTSATVSVIKNNFLFGIGVDHENLTSTLSSTNINNSDYFVDIAGVDNKDDTRLSNSFFRVFVYFGLPLGIFLIFKLYNQVLFPGNKILFFLILSISMCFSPLLFTPFFINILMSGLIPNKNKNLG